MRLRHRRIPIAVLALLVGLSPGWIAAESGTEAGAGPAEQTVEIDGLEWALATNGQNIKWPEAVEYCEALELADHDDWRLPSLAELERLHDPDAAGGEGIRGPFSIGDCCLWSGESLVDRPAEDGEEIAGEPGMYHWGFMFDGGLRYYAVHIFDDGRALCTRDAG